MARNRPLVGVCLGAGYFSRFHHEAWARITEVRIAAVCDRSLSRAQAVAQDFGVSRYYGGGDWERMLDEIRPDFLDIITPPETHLAAVKLAARKGIPIVCQKPLAPSLRESEAIVRVAEQAGVRFLVHENWRWQPWYREIKRQLDAGVLGKLHSLSVRMRMGDGWPQDAYQSRQPFFREYPRLLIYETGIHFLDTFRFLGGEVSSVYARLQQRNSEISGEDAAQVVVGFRSGAIGIVDASRFNESDATDPRFTFGQVRVDASKGHIELDFDGSLTLKLLGEPARPVEYTHERRGFAGDCVYHLQRHFVDCLLSGEPFESTGRDYLRSIELVEACYESDAHNQVVRVGR